MYGPEHEAWASIDEASPGQLPQSDVSSNTLATAASLQPGWKPRLEPGHSVRQPAITDCKSCISSRRQDFANVSPSACNELQLKNRSCVPAHDVAQSSRGHAVAELATGMVEPVDTHHTRLSKLIHAADAGRATLHQEQGVASAHTARSLHRSTLHGHQRADRAWAQSTAAQPPSVPMHNPLAAPGSPRGGLSREPSSSGPWGLNDPTLPLYLSTHVHSKPSPVSSAEVVVDTRVDFRSAAVSSPQNAASITPEECRLYQSQQVKDSRPLERNWPPGTHSPTQTSQIDLAMGHGRHFMHPLASKHQRDNIPASMSHNQNAAVRRAAIRSAVDNSIPVEIEHTSGIQTGEDQHDVRPRLSAPVPVYCSAIHM